MSKQIQMYNQPEFPVEQIQEIAKQENIPVTGITIMGGRPYINVTGLDVKLRNKCKDEKLELMEVRATKIQDPTKENGYLCGFHAEVILFDRENFSKSLTKLKEVDKESLKELKDVYTYRFTGEGWASPSTCEAIGFKYEYIQGKKTKTDILVENIIMMAERRATNRAKREATGTGLTSVDELPLENIPVEEKTANTGRSRVSESKIPEELRKNIFSDSVKKYVSERKFKEWCKQNGIPNMADVKLNLQIFYDTDDISKLTIADIEKWREYIEDENKELSDEEVTDGVKHPENIERFISGSEDTGSTTQGDFLNGAD